MLSRFSEALQTAADVLAPPVSRLVDFQYHWKLIQHFYINESVPMKVHVENTKIPLHLHQMLQFLVDEQLEYGEKIGPCLEDITDSTIGICECLTGLAESDRPTGLRSTTLAWYTALLRRVEKAPLHKPAIYRPILKLLISCNNNYASPTEKEEVELLLTLCGHVRKKPSLAALFLSRNYEEVICPVASVAKMKKPKRNKLFDFDTLPVTMKRVSIISQSTEKSQAERSQMPLPHSENHDIESTSSASANEDDTSECKNVNNFNENDRFLLMDLLLSYLSSADNHIILRACEGIMIVASLPDDNIAYLIANTSSVSDYLIDILVDKYECLPANTDPCDIDQLNITWGYASQEFAERFVKTIGLRETTSFLSWLDYCDTLAKECHIILATCLARTLRWHFLAAELELGLAGRHHAVLVTAVVGKCLKSVDSTELLNEISRWVVGDCANVTVRGPSPVLQTLIENCFEGGIELCLETLRLFETMLEKASEHILHCLAIGFLEGRGYHTPPRPSYHPEDEERDRLNAQSLQQERDSNRQTMKRVCEGFTDGTIAPWPEIITNKSSTGCQTAVSTNIHKVINSFLLILPRNLLSDPAGLGYEQYMQDAHRHYLGWVESTSSFNWPSEAVWHDQTGSSTHSCDSRPEADLHMNSSPCTPCPRHKNSPESGGHQCDETVFTDDNNVKGVENQPLLQKSENGTEDLLFKYPMDKNSSTASSDKIPTQCLGTNIQGKHCGSHCENLSNSFHQQLVLSQKDRCSLSEMAEDEDMTFDEGPFFRALFKLMLNVHQQPYQINLQLTAIFSKLAMMPHPYLHEYLLNPVLPTGKNVPTLFKTLQKLAKVFLSQIPRVKKFETIIEQTRQRLLGDDTSDDSDKTEPLFESLIVVEEFCKELAAISFVKYHHASQQSAI